MHEQYEMKEEKSAKQRQLEGESAVVDEKRRADGTGKFGPIARGGEDKRQAVAVTVEQTVVDGRTLRKRQIEMHPSCVFCNAGDGEIIENSHSHDERRGENVTSVERDGISFRVCVAIDHGVDVRRVLSVGSRALYGLPLSVGEDFAGLPFVIPHKSAWECG